MERGEQRIDRGEEQAVLQGLASPGRTLRAPKFWPMIGPTDPDSAKMMPKATGTSRPTMARPATASSPKGATSWVM